MNTQRSRSALLLTLALAAAGCSGKEDDSAPNDTSSGGQTSQTPDPKDDPKCNATFAPTDPNDLIDDMEDGDPALVSVSGRNGEWWLATDHTSGTAEPVKDNAPSPERIIGGRCSSKQAIHVSGQGFTTWGAVLTLGLKYGSQAEPVDVSEYTGIEFWARLGGDLSQSSVRVQLQDAATRPEGGVCDPVDGSAEACYNGHGTVLEPLDGDWRLYQLPFAKMAQQPDWGHRTPTLDTTTLYSIEWQLPMNAVFDLWVDDVWFYR